MQTDLQVNISLLRKVVRLILMVMCYFTVLLMQFWVLWAFLILARFSRIMIPNGKGARSSVFIKEVAGQFGILYIGVGCFHHNIEEIKDVVDLLSWDKRATVLRCCCCKEHILTKAMEVMQITGLELV